MSSRLSLSMIVKNEEHTLRACLESVRHVVDEIIIVDTGSTDATVAIAKQFHAKIFFFPWNGNFSDARNESLLHCTGDWILQLDADERLEARDKKKLRAAISTTTADGLEIFVVSRKTERNKLTMSHSLAVRLFRRDERFRFQYSIHENIIASIEDHHGKIIHSDITIHHDGYDIAETDIEKKLLRNLPPLLQDAERYPNDVFVLSKLVQTQFQLHQNSEAEKTLARAFLVIQSGKATHAASSRIAHLHILYGEIRLQQGALREAEHSGLESLRLAPRQYAAHVLLTRVFDQQNKIEEAIRHTDAILSLHAKQGALSLDVALYANTDSVSEGDCTPLLEDVYYKRAVLFRKINNETAEEKELRVTLQHSPVMVSALLDIAALQARQGKLQESLSFVQQAIRLEPNNEFALQLRGKVFYSLQQFSESLASLQQAFSLGVRSDEALILLIQLTKRFQNDEATLPYFEELYARHSSAGDVVFGFIQALAASQHVARALEITEHALLIISDEQLKEQLQRIREKLYQAREAAV